MCDLFPSELQSLKLEIHNCLGAIGTEINDPKLAERHYSTVIESLGDPGQALQSAEDGDRWAAAKNEMGIAHLMMGHTEEAKDTLDFSCGISMVYRRSSHNALSIYLLASANLALAHWLDREYDEAMTVLDAAWRMLALQSHAEENSFRSVLLLHLRLVSPRLTSRRPARLMYAMGNVKESQGLLDESFDWHEKALAHFKRTSGINHHRTADVECRMALHYIRKKEFQNAQ